MATPWSMEGHWFKSCNCNPGCPCVDLTGLHWAGVIRWPGAMHQGNGNLQPIVDAQANARQRATLLAIMSGRHGDTLFELIASLDLQNLHASITYVKPGNEAVTGAKPVVAA